jgi:hypothetical protein
MLTVLISILAWCTISLAIGGLMIWRPIPIRKTRRELKYFTHYALN